MMRFSRHSSRSTTPQGFSLVEVVVSTILVGTLLVAAMRCAGSSILTQTLTAERAKAAWLADALAMEIHRQSYLEPGQSTSAITREAGESANSRSNYDDVDDYHGWTASPPQHQDGSVIADLSGWQRSVTVAWVTPGDLQVTSGTETGVKRITVTVSRNGTVLASRTFIRSKGN